MESQEVFQTWDMHFLILSLCFISCAKKKKKCFAVRLGGGGGVCRIREFIFISIYLFLKNAMFYVLNVHVCFITDQLEASAHVLEPCF